MIMDLLGNMGSDALSKMTRKLILFFSNVELRVYKESEDER